MSTALDTAWLRPSKPHRLAPCCRSAIEGALTAETVARAARNAPPWDQELERNALGSALAGSPMPSWLTAEMFFPQQHQRIYAAALEARGDAARACHLLRDVVGKVEIARLVEGCVWAQRQGWAIELERLRELWKVRTLLAGMERVAVRLRGGETFEAGLAELREMVRRLK